MTFIKLFWFDIRRGLLRKPLFFALPVFLSLTSCFHLLTRVGEYNSLGIFSGRMRAGFADFMMYLYGGMDIYQPSLGVFVFPVRWMILFLFPAFFTLNHPFEDMSGFGQQILIRTNGRTAWWLSKCMWNALSVGLYHGLIYLTVFLFCETAGADSTGGFQRELLYALFQTAPAHRRGAAELPPLSILLIPIFLSIGISLAQMALSLFFKPIFCFFATALLLITSAYAATPCLIGNYAMPMRFDTVITNGVSARAGTIIAAVLVPAAIIAGNIRFRHYDILNREEIN